MATYLKKMKLSFWAILQLRNNTSHKNWENLETTEPKVAVTSEMKLQVRLKLQNNMIPKLESNLNLFENETQVGLISFERNIWELFGNTVKAILPLVLQNCYFLKWKVHTLIFQKEMYSITIAHFTICLITVSFLTFRLI